MIDPIDSLDAETVAMIAHEAQRSWCESQGDYDLPPWADASDAVRAAALDTVRHLIACPEMTAQELHDWWVLTRAFQGWVWGERLCDAQRHDPHLCDYAELPAEQRYRLDLFVAIVKASRPYLRAEDKP